MAEAKLGNLAVHLTAIDETTGVFNNYIKMMNKMTIAVKEFNDKASIMAGGGLFNQIKRTLAGIGNPFVAMGKGLDFLKGAASWFFLPLKILATSFIAVKSTIYAAGIAAVKTAADFEFFHAQLTTFIGDKEKVNKVWKESMGEAGFFSVEQTMNARLRLERVGIAGKESMEIIRDMAVITGQGIEEIATSLLRITSGTMRGLRLMGVNFAVEGSR